LRTRSWPTRHRTCDRAVGKTGTTPAVLDLAAPVDDIYVLGAAVKRAIQSRLPYKPAPTLRHSTDRPSMLPPWPYPFWPQRGRQGGRQGATAGNNAQAHGELVKSQETDPKEACRLHCCARHRCRACLLCSGSLRVCVCVCEAPVPALSAAVGSLRLVPLPHWPVCSHLLRHRLLSASACMCGATIHVLGDCWNTPL